ncbi:metal ABC transporter permease [Serratia marcescens]|uniref:Metal ABC transporter permease n=1 Tax=Serratia marcescens TaxID=615 RepID=A0A939SUN4_SERMA|nr:metal ABC transporter permease [Serratia marcescens]
MMLWHALIDPFLSFGFMRRAHGVPGVVAQRRPAGRVSAAAPHELVGDALSHAVLPGAAIGYLISGMSLVAMGVGGFIAGLAVAMLSGGEPPHAAERGCQLRRVLSGIVGAGVTLVSLRGSSVDLLHVLFGSILAVDAQAMVMVGAIASVSLLALAALYRALVIESFDVTFLRVNAPPLGADPRPVSGAGGGQSGGGIPDPRHLNVGGADDAARRQRAFGRAICRRHWRRRWASALSSVIGLVWSYYASLPAGPAIVLSASVIFRLDPVWNARRHLRLRAVESAICKEKV